MMMLLRCEVSEGVGSVAVSVAVRDVANQKTFLELDRNMVARREGQTYIPVGTVYRDKEKGVALIEFPQEADSGAHRIWVRLDSLIEPNGVSA
jgi:hypothetical protein